MTHFESDVRAIKSITDFERQKWDAYFSEALQGAGQEHEKTLWWRVSDEDTFKIIQPLFESHESVSVLEAACGSGGSSFLLSDFLQIKTLTLSDISFNALKFAKTLQPQRMTATTRYLRADIFRLPFKDCSFDLVWNVGTIEHYPTLGIREILRELTRVTKERGWVVLGIPNRWSIAVLKAWALGTRFAQTYLQRVPGYRFDSEILYGNKDIGRIILEEVGYAKMAFAGSCLWTSAPEWLVRYTQWLMPMSRFSFLVFYCAQRQRGSQLRDGAAR